MVSFVDAGSWGFWREKFASACDGTHNTIDEIERGLFEGRSHHLVGQGCSFIVEIVEYPGERTCQVTWAAGDLDAIVATLPDLEAWAIQQGCTEILEEGHAGWARVLKRHGWKPWSVTMRKALTHGTVQ
jgi:hypothetical protein